MTNEQMQECMKKNYENIRRVRTSEDNKKTKSLVLF